MEENQNFSTDVFSVNMPYSLEAEQSILGAAILKPDLLTEIMNKVKPEYFYQKNNRLIYGVLIEMFTGGNGIDIVTILENVKNLGIFDTPQQARVYIYSLAEILPSVSNVESYIEIIKQKYILRSLIDISKEIVTNAMDSSADATALMNLAEQKIYDIREGKSDNTLVPIKDVLIETYDHLQKLSGERRNDYLGISTGYSALDNYITGLNKSDLLLIAARPGMGKTAFALNIAANVGIRGKKTVAIFSLEMGREQLAQRLLSSEALVESQKIKIGSLNDDDWTSISNATASLAQTDIYIDDTAGVTVADMKAKLRRLKNIDLVVIDYLQLMSTGKNSNNRVQEVSEITRNLKIMAKELNIPVITLSQLSRGTESRTDHKPMLSDLRESGSIEQDADIVMFLYREGYYNDEADDQTTAKCIVAKNRHGSTGTIDLYWDGQYTRFSSIEYRN